MFIKNTPSKSTLQKTFLPSKIKMKSALKIMKQPLWAVHAINNKIIEIIEKLPQSSPFPPKTAALLEMSLP